MASISTILFIVCLWELFLHRTLSYQLPTYQFSRRGWFAAAAVAIAIPSHDAHALTDEEIILDVEKATDTLQLLLDNWQRAVIDCTFADVPRELLETKNKQELLEKASTFALFDKSVSVETCKTTNRIVREYIGKTGKGPVQGLEKKLRALLPDDPDYLDTYVELTESIQQNLAKADSLSYTAGVADFSAVNNFEKENQLAVLASDSNLEQARKAIASVVVDLRQLLKILKR